jgi:hypothetical protein
VLAQASCFSVKDSKFEARNSKFETISNGKNSNDPNKKSTDSNFQVFCFGDWGIEYLGFVSNFDIRILAEYD